MFVNVVDVSEGGFEVLEAILDAWSTCPPQAIKEGAEIAMDRSSNKSASSSK